ncbi:MAG: CBASS cGAMP-activated phospholipase [Gemmatimonadetes bacterium]|nr:CBASS cGAMP-activated phospholipase [Gemmatimonadota bacterium]
MDNPTSKADVFSILSVDGGGTRGVYAAQILARVEDSLESEIRDCFDLLAGTSTGSIITGAAAAGIPMKQVVSLFEEESPLIFGKAKFPSRVSFYWRSRYSSESLEKSLAKHIPDIVLRDVNTPLIITSADIATGGVHVFKSRYLMDLGEPYERDGNVPLRDAILASCAAPTYFDPRLMGPYILADGGLWANNPSIIALSEALSKFNKGVENVYTLSLGTGYTAEIYASQKSWGLLTGWGASKLVSYILSLQSQASTNIAKLILNERYLRLDTEIDTWELDDTVHLANLKALADRDFTYQSKAILKHIRRGIK